VKVEPRKPNPRGSNLGILLSNNVAVNIWKLKNLSDTSNGAEECFLPPYSVAELLNNHG